MRPEGLRSASLPRGVLAAVVGIDLISFFPFLGQARLRAVGEGAAIGMFADLFSRPAVSVPVIVIGVVSAFVFGRRAGQFWAGCVSLGTLALLSTVHAELFGTPWRHLYYSGLCLLGWLLGLAVSRSSSQATADESYACMGSTALLAGAYLNGGISKVALGGVDWALGLPIQAIVVAQDGMVADSAVSAYRSWIVTTPIVAGLFAFATVALELAAPLILVGGVVGAGVTLGLLAMHVNILVLTHILYWEAMVSLVLFGLLPRRSTPAAAHAASVPTLFHGRPFVVSVLLLVLCSLLAIQHQSRRFALWYESGAVGAPGTSGVESGESGRAPGPDTVTGLQQLGPYAAGETLLTGWRLESLGLTDDGFTAVVVGKPGPVRFEVTCASSQYHSQFDVGAAHVFYSGSVAFRDLDAVARSFQSRLKDVDEGRGLCGRLEAWRTVAQGQPRR